MFSAAVASLLTLSCLPISTVWIIRFGIEEV
jgi:hypothetical protein